MTNRPKLNEMGKVVPSGKYTIRCEEGSDCQISGNGALFIRWDVSVIEPGEMKGKHISLTSFLSDKGQWTSAAYFKAFGIDEQAEIPVDDQEEMQGVINLCVGKTAIAIVGVETDPKYGSKNILVPSDAITAPETLESGPGF